jgi:glutamine amidotransferase
LTAVIDYDAGNIFSVKNALEYLGIENVLTKDIEIIEKADRVILPGVGAFPWAIKQLEKYNLIETLKKAAAENPFLGICLGMQLLFTKSFEFEECEGLDLIPGSVEKINDTGLVIPHMGWNQLVKTAADNGKTGNLSGEYVYFVHSFKAVCDDKYTAYYCEYGEKIPALVQKGNVFGAQFHPEKSGETGLEILRKFSQI